MLTVTCLKSEEISVLRGYFVQHLRGWNRRVVKPGSWVPY